MNEKKTIRHLNNALRSAGIVLLILLLFVTLSLFVACGDSDGGVSQTRASITDEFKTEYFVGDTFVEVGQMKLFTDIDYYSLVPITAEMVSGFDTSHPGTIIVTVTYGEFIATMPVNVRAVKALSLTLNEEAIPETIYEGKPFPSGLTLSAVLSNGTTVEDVAVTASMLGGFDSSVIGAQNVTVSYLGATASFTVTVKKDARQSITLVGSPKREYAVGEQLSVENAYLDVLYESGKTDRATLTKNLVSGFSTALGGRDLTATITYGGLTCDYVYSVIREPISFLFEAGSLPAVYEKNDPLPATGKGVISYDDGTSERIDPLALENIPGFDTSTAGEKEVEVIVEGVSDTYSYTVLPGIVSATPYGYTSAVQQNAPFDKLGGLLVVYESGTEPQSESLPLWNADSVQETAETEDGVLQTIVTGRLRIEYCTSETGDTLQKIYFRSRTIEFPVHVYDENERATAVNGISVAGTFRSIVLGDPIDVSGVRVGIDYKYLDYDVVDCVAAWVTAETPENIDGDYVDVPVTITYLGAEANSTVRVLSAAYAAKVTAIAVYGIPTLYSVGDELSSDNAGIYAVYGGGYSSATIAVLPEYVSGFDTSTAGEKTMTVTYNACAFTIEYRVISEADKMLVTDLTVYGFNPLLFVGDTIQDVPLTYELTLTLGYGYDHETLSFEDEDAALAGGPFDEAGEQEVTLTCRGYEITLSVTVHPASDKERVTAIAVVSDDITADVGMQPDLTQVLLAVEYGYGHRMTRIPLGSAGVAVDMAPLLNVTKAGSVHTTVTYAGQTCGLIVNFVSGDSGNVLQRMEIEAGSKDSFTIGEDLDGVSLILYYRDGAERMPVTADMVPDFITEEAGEYTVTISYGGKGVMYTYRVAPAPEQQEETNEEEE